VNLGESLLAVPRLATAYVSQMAHPAIQILPPAKTKSKPRDVLVSILSEDTSIVVTAGPFEDQFRDCPLPRASYCTVNVSEMD